VITFHTGDATQPQLPGRLVIAHVLSDTGAYDAGFAAAVAARYPLAKQRFQAWAHGGREVYARPFMLGVVQWVGVGHELGRAHRFGDRWVANMVAQCGLRSAKNPYPLKLDALTACLGELAGIEMPIVMPRIGCGLAGGNWAEVEPLIDSVLGNDDVHVYDLPESAATISASDPLEPQ
jgi:O-acetyl-ADP-ribose deacetylase (regulator of RNase III)